MSTKEKVLAQLKTSTEFLSGERLAEQLQVSRTAVWKAVKELEKSGYQIQHGAKGYRYQQSDILDAQEIQTGLQQNLTVKVLNTSSSTMKDAQLAVLEGAISPILVIADMQEAPHGRFNRPFFAVERSGIYMSLLLQPEELLSELPQYTVLTAVAVAEAIDHLVGVETAIKWVNDIYLNGKKVVGILSEAMTDVETSTLKHVVIGMGINFSIPQEAFPEEIRKKATSLYPDTSPAITRNQLIIEIWNRFFQLLEAKTTDFLVAYRQKSNVLGKQVTFERQGKSFSGKAVAINELGELVVAIGSKEMILSSGEISLSSIQ
ncbi:bifunctional ligase/repressor BirA [Enterococcus florum]|uniref:Bifunctional ligase/repressor BirA n=1 Tax=Enterococcus florum TaxID=2480627 RepID=A0A4P5P950_9ENTE|nr:biotin--[acetyl-CoA-carboxylase] ligase [Enterococcus florum]GCF94595.1 bifunctional ligase/repressor BirA [Enterococcus florum]